MRSRPPVRPALLVAILLGAAGRGARAGDPPPAAGPYGDTYTAEELAALDRALHAGNCTREDLTFRKDMAKGAGCLPVVKALLHDPLAIAPTMDRLAAATDVRGPGGLTALLATATVCFGDAATAPDLRGPRDAAAARLAAPAPPFTPTTPAQALVFLEGLLARQPELPAPSGPTEAERLVAGLALRHALPEAMAWHPVGPSPYADRAAAIGTFLEGKPPAWLHEEAARIDPEAMAKAWVAAFGPLLATVQAWPADAFPTDAPVVRTTPFGRVGIGTLGDETWTGDFAAIVDPGGDDRYERGRFGAAFGVPDRRVGVVVDLGGDDVYDAGATDVTFGAAVLGVALLADLGGGNDRYAGGNVSLGAAVGGVGVLYDDGGSDTYQGRAFTEGAAGFGIGLLVDDAVGPPAAVPTDEETKDPVPFAAFDDDRLDAWVNAMGFARPRGVAFCLNRRGNDVYHAGGVYLHAPLFADRYQSFSQGFSIGSRDVDWAGGVALALDRDGNDRWLGDVYDQGVGYWYAAGLLWDGGGHDLYEMTQYGQGSGIHLAVGGLVDVAGSDAYVMHSGLGQGGSHDFAASVLHDRGGNDRYHGNTSCNGCGLTNAVGLHLDRAGDDTYAARRDGGFNGGRPARGFGSVGVLVDLAGKDDYLAAFRDGDVRREPDLGLAVDVDRPDPAGGATGGTPAADRPSGRAEPPAVCRHVGPLTDAVFDELWAIACRWEVGDNRAIVPVARRRLVEAGKDVLPRLEGKMEQDASGLEVRAYVDVLGGVAEAGGRDEVVALLRRNLASPVDRRKRLSLTLVGELKVKALEAEVAALLDAPDESLPRRVAGVLAALGSHAGDARLVRWLASAHRAAGSTDRGDEARILAALGVLLGLGSDAGPEVENLLDHPLVTVRTRLATLLAERGEPYAATLRRWLLKGPSFPDPAARALRTVLDAYHRGPLLPDAPLARAVAALLEHGDPGVRADAARLLRRWAAAPKADPAVVAEAIGVLTRRLADEPDPLVRTAGAAPAPGAAK